MSNELQTAFNEIAELRSLPQEVVLEALQSALISAYRKDSGASAAQEIDAKIDTATGRARIFVEKEVVEDIFNEATEVTVEDARFYDPECAPGDMVMVQVQSTTRKFGRIAAQTAKQVILQKIREAERNALYDEFITREGDIITGTVQSINSSMITLSLGRAEAILPRAQQIPREWYNPRDKIRVYVLEVKRANRGPQIIVSRSHRNMLRRLLEYEVPEIYNGQVEIRNIAREAGYRSKVSVVALQDGIDPVGACVGMKGIRIQNIVKELHDEKIDIIEWQESNESFIAESLKPARVTGVYLEDDPYTGRTAVVIVPDDQLSLAIGREGQNARLAAKLTGWRIDIKSVTETVQGALENLEIPPLSSLLETDTDLVEEARRIIQKKQENLTVMPEEYNALNRFSAKVEDLLLADREEARRIRLEELDAIKATLPVESFELPISVLELPDNIDKALKPLENVGEVLLACVADEARIQKLLSRVPDDPMNTVQAALDHLMTMDLAALVTAFEQAAAQEKLEAEAAITEVEPEAVVAEGTVADEPVTEETITAAEEEQVLDAFGGEPIEESAAPVTEPEVVPVPAVEPEPSVAFEVEDYAQELLDDAADGEKKKKKERQKRRQLVLDEESGQVIAKRRRKGRRSRDEWDGDDDF